MMEGTVNFEDLPEAEDNDRGEVEDINDCVAGSHHVFLPHVSFCQCGVLQRGFPSISHIPWAVAVWPVKPATLYTVRFSNYDPPEIDSIHTDKAKAEARCEELVKDPVGGWGWHVEERHV